ncbi:eIF-2-alpha kinase GCN2 [Ceratocystis fimbriata CBS 114723]|uniref:non-specific serine/threonine protein kinase n=1 Tax=Ceratocystis fimbriata CBS 114723 TaxID=1035309 RepID=A0A2C5X2D7_9PEZI|nr:eIF-2-alpha kinase GCN2 [Ceratocystis fimbriata CBS 114723]
MSSLSLIPYSSAEGREIVLRHRNAIVVRDPTSQQLDIRLLTECPTCHRSLQPSVPPSDQNGFEGGQAGGRHESYVNPEYFRMLRAGAYSHRIANSGARPESEMRPGQGGAGSPPLATSRSPLRRYVQPILPGSVSAPSNVFVENPEDEESPSQSQQSSPRPGQRQQPSSGIKREAFSPHYFRTFFVEEKVLGKGGKGVVLLVRHQIDGCTLGHFACKRVPVGNDHAWLEKVLVEVELLAKLSHPNLVSYRHVWLEDVQLSMFGPSVACAFILQQYCNGGDLLNYVAGSAPAAITKEDLKAQLRRRRSRSQQDAPSIPRRRLPLEEIYSLFKDVTSGLVYLHANSYIHRDLKPSNCLLHHDDNSTVATTCLISDFGEVQVENAARKSTGSTGTISYCAPEVLRKDAGGRYGNFTTKSDIFSLGMILYFMCFGRLPYRNSNATDEEQEDIDLLREEILCWEGFHEERRERPDLPPKLYQLIKTLLAVDPTNRPSAAEVLAAIRNESPFEPGMRGTGGVAPLGIRRVQPVDTPSPSATPTPDGRSTPQSNTTLPATGPNPFAAGSHRSSRSPAQASGLDHGEIENPRLRLQTAAISHGQGQELTHHRGSVHEIPNNRQHADSENVSEAISTSTALQRSPTHHSLLASDSSTPPHTNSLPLLMAPPTTMSISARPAFAVLHGLRLAILVLDYYIDSLSAPLLLTLRWFLFLAKAASIVQPCAPYIPSISAALPLIGLAGLDLLLPLPSDVASNSLGAGLSSSPPARLGRHRRGRRIAAGQGESQNEVPLFTWTFSGAVVLGVVHMLVLWWTTRAGTLCILSSAAKFDRESE